LAAIARGERACGDFEMRIDREGRWYYRGSPIERLPLVKLFARVLRRAEDGGYWLVTPVEQGRIEVEDAPFVAVELRREGEGPAQRLDFRTNLDEWVMLDREHPLRLAPLPEGGQVPYLLVRDRLEARVARPVFYELVELAEPAPDDGGDGVVGVWSAGRFFPLGSTHE
jgi:hypothetical protein